MNTFKPWMKLALAMFAIACASIVALAVIGATFTAPAQSAPIVCEVSR